MVIRDGEHVNQTLASVRYDRYGAKTRQEWMICDDWSDGFAHAKKSKHSAILFVDSGTVFLDWIQWIKALETYPHRGLIGHIVWNRDSGTYPWLHPQCWYMSGDIVDATLWQQQTISSPAPVASQQNIHDDYTPLYLKPHSARQCTHPVSEFGQNFIAAQLSRHLPVVNWHQKMRSLKHYLYADNPSQNAIWQRSQQEYLDLAENQFWILNNEPITLRPGRTQLSPGSGLHWILNICHPDVHEITVVDASAKQVEFARHLWHNWDGSDYGQQVIDYIKLKQLRHFEIDQPDLDKLQRIKLQNPIYLRRYVNDKFSALAGGDFQQQWQRAKRTKTATFQCGNLVQWVLDHGLQNTDAIWLSNILDYKWTLLKSSKIEIDKFKTMVASYA